MKVWVDTESGTWGDVVESPLVILNLTEAEVEAMDRMSDNDRSQWAWQAAADGKGKVIR